MNRSIDNNNKAAPGDAWFPAALVIAAVLFNAVLAYVNGSIMPLGMSHIVVCELLIVFAAHAYALANFDRRMTPWYMLIIAVGAFALLRMVMTGGIELKYFRDLLLLQTFIVLGMTTSLERATQAMLFLTAIVVAGVLLEAFSLETYSSVFHVKDFYINTRGLVSGDFTNEASDLYVSASRPDSRHMPFFGLHRLSSIFLEPVSLGNFVVIAVSFTAAFWSALSTRVRLCMVFSCGLMLVASDGRLAAAAIVLIMLAVVFRPLIPKYSAVFILPIVVLITVVVVSIGDWYSGVDTLKGRLAYTVQLIHNMRVSDYLGFSDRLVTKAVDSGVVYLVITQSFVMVAALWVLISFGLDESTDARRNYKNSICLYLALTMMVSFSFVSIKTAAPLWFLYGALVVSRRAAPASAADTVGARAAPGNLDSLPIG